MTIGPLCVCYLVHFRLSSSLCPVGYMGLFGLGWMFYSGAGYILWARLMRLMSFILFSFRSLLVFSPCRCSVLLCGSIVWVLCLSSFFRPVVWLRLVVSMGYFLRRRRCASDDDPNRQFQVFISLASIVGFRWVVCFLFPLGWFWGCFAWFSSPKVVSRKFLGKFYFS